MPIPYGLENCVSKPLYKKALDCFFTQIVIDPKHLRLFEPTVDHFIKFMGTLEVSPKRLFNNYLGSGILALVTLGQTTSPKVFQNWHKDTGRSGYVEKALGRRSDCFLNGGNLLLQFLKTAQIVVSTSVKRNI